MVYHGLSGWAINLIKFLTSFWQVSDKFLTSLDRILNFKGISYFTNMRDTDLIKIKSQSYVLTILIGSIIWLHCKYTLFYKKLQLKIISDSILKNTPFYSRKFLKNFLIVPATAATYGSRDFGSSFAKF